MKYFTQRPRKAKIGVVMKQREEIIREVPLLARLSEADRRDLASSGRVRSYASGDVLFHEGDRGDSLHIVIEGRVRIAVLSSTGAEAAVGSCRCQRRAVRQVPGLRSSARQSGPCRLNLPHKNR